MKKNLLILVALLTSATISAQNGGTIMKKYENQLPQAGRGNVHVAYQGKAIDQMIYDFMEEQGIPGMTLAIVQAPYIPRVAGYGVTDLEKGNLAAAKTLWPIGPISQGYAAVAVMQLYEKRKLDLNDPIGKYLKDIPENWKPISILQLMQHSSGIADYRNEKGFDVSADYRPEQLIETVAAIPTGDRRETERHKLSATDFYHRKDRQDAISRLCEKVSDRLPGTETDIFRRRPGESKTGGRDPHRQRASDIQKK